MANIPNNFYRTSIKALILDDLKRFLLILEDNGLWELPGGGLDFGEKPEQCLQRELKEEMGLEISNIEIRPLYFITALNINKIWKSAVIYKVHVKDLASFKATDECLEYKFFTKEEALKVKLYPVVKEFLKVYDASKI